MSTGTVKFAINPTPRKREWTIEQVTIRVDLHMEATGSAHHLPQQFTSFIGRQVELDDLGQLLADPTCRLVTLVGPGGIGKTRLAMVATAVYADRFPNGSYFVNLQPVFEANFFITAVADALSFSLTGKEEPLTQLCAQLHQKRVLLTLDNFEQLHASAELLIHLLQHTAVTLLVTSRVALQLKEERLYPLKGLTVEGEQTIQADAVQLFRDRARRLQPHFKVESNLASVKAICQRVEGMPLAIELAAAWTRTLSCAAILREIEQNLDFLTTHLRNMPERHRSIHVIFAQTWSQLTPQERAVFRRLSVFRGGFRREAAAAVADATLPILSSLIDKSLLRWEPSEKGTFYGRYQIHELLRQFAAEKLSAQGQEVEDVQQRHGAYCARFLHERLEDLLGERQQEAIDEINAELQNVRAAWQFLIARADLANLEQAAMPLLSFYWFQSRILEGKRAFQQAVTKLQQMPATRLRDRVLASTQTNLAWFLMITSDFEASNRLAKHSIQLLERHQLSPAHGLDTEPRLVLCNNARLTDDLETAEKWAREALRHSKRHAHLGNIREAYRLLGSVQIAKGDLEQARQNVEKSLRLAQQLGDRFSEAYAHETLGNAAFDAKDYPGAEQHFRASYAIWESSHHELGSADMEQRFGELALARGDYEAAANWFNKCLPLFEQSHVPGGVLATLIRLAETAVRQKQYDAAQHHLLRSLSLIHTYPTQFAVLVFRFLTIVADWLIGLGITQEACSILACLWAQPELGQEEKRRVQPLLALCRGRLSEAVYQDAVAEGCSIMTSTLISRVEPLLQSPPTLKASPSEQPLVDPLTPRELEVLHHIADGLSNQQIADKLIISLGTVKYYTSTIYSKLAVSRRTEAIAHAREIGLLL